MQNFPRRRRVRRRFAFGGVGLAAVVALLVALAIPAAADTIPFTGQGTNADGTCGEFEGQPPAPGGTQTWQFNLTGTAGPATMSATFSDGTSVTDLPEDQPHSGNVSKWSIVTDAGASVVTASATRPESDGNPQFVVSHCTAGGEKPPPTTTPETSTTPTTKPAAPSAPSAAVPVTAGARF